jgi:DNA replication protein
MKIYKHMLNWKKHKHQRPEKLREFLAKTEFYKILAEYDYEPPCERECSNFDVFERFFADLHIARLDEPRIAALNRCGWNIKGEKFPWPDKGVFIFGNCGSGKTFLANIFCAEFEFHFFDVDELTDHYLAKDGDDWFCDFVEKHQHTVIVIDDFGSERVAKKYGSESIISSLVNHREKSYRYYGVPTIFTSNFAKSDEIAAHYGDRIKSRIMGMCDCVCLARDDKRKETE